MKKRLNIFWGLREEFIKYYILTILLGILFKKNFNIIELLITNFVFTLVIFMLISAFGEKFIKK